MVRRLVMLGSSQEKIVVVGKEIKGGNQYTTRSTLVCVHSKTFSQMSNKKQKNKYKKKKYTYVGGTHVIKN